MKKYGIVLADGGQQIALIVAHDMDQAIHIFAKKMRHMKWAYNKGFRYAHIGTAPYIVTDKHVQITAFEY